MRRRSAAAAVLLLVNGCTRNPRNEIAAIADAALDEARRTSSPGFAACVSRTIAPWEPARAAGRIDLPAPPGFDALIAPGVFRGGGGLKGARAGGVPISGRAGCLELRGPLVAGDRAVIEAHLPGFGWNAWLHRDAGDWRVVMTTTSSYPREGRPSEPLTSGADR